MKTLTEYLFGNEEIKWDEGSISHALSGLPADNQKAIELHFVKMLSRKEIASSLGWSRSKVDQKITRGITLLKLKLNPDYFRRADEIMLQTAHRLLLR